MPEGGKLVVLLGPSGSGKDTLLKGLKQALGDNTPLHFVRRAITRPPDPDGEDHLPMNEASFAALEQTGHFAVTWQANGLHYGLPREALSHVQGGGIAIANGSRGALPDIRHVFGDVLVLLIQVKQDELRQRLIARGRETKDQITVRLNRARAFNLTDTDIVYIDNSGPVDEGVARLEGLIKPLLAE